MVTFDVKAYKQEVLKPASSGEGAEQLREVLQALSRDPKDRSYAKLDLAKLYAVPTPATHDDLKAWQTKITSTLNKATTFPASNMLKTLLQRLEEQGNNLLDPSFWGSLVAERQKFTHEALVVGIGQLRQEYPLGVATLEELASRLTAIGVVGVTGGSIKSVAEREGFEVFPEIELPGSELPSPGLVASWRNLLKGGAYRSVLDVVLMHDPSRCRDVTFIDGLAAGGRILSVRDVASAHEKADKSKDSDDLQLAKKFLSTLKNDVTDDAKLRDVIVITFVQLIEARLGRGQPIVAVRDYVVSCGVEKSDASRLVAAVGATSAGSGGSAPRIGLDSVREMLAQGQLADAERTLASIAVEPDEAEAAQKLSDRIGALKQQKSDALARYQASLKARDLHQASLSIGEAIAIDTADESLLALRAAVPPTAPTSLQARVDGESVLLSWIPSADGEISYTLVRGTTQMPRTVHEGKTLASGLATASYVDKGAQPGHTATYAVFATRDGKIFSDAAKADVLVLPPPTSVRAESRISTAELSWRVPSAAVGVSVIQDSASGASIETEVLRGSTLVVENLVLGERYRYTLRAIYLTDKGRQFSQATTISLAARGPAQAVRDLQILVPEAGSSQLRAEWGAVEGYDIELWAFPHSVELQAGASADAGNLTAQGGNRTAAAGPNNSQGRCSASLTEFSDVVKIYPLTVTDSGFIVGEPVIAGAAQPITNIVIEGFGDCLRVSWDWPQGDYIIELQWRDGGNRRTRRVTRARYRTEGGTVIANASGVTELSVATVARVDDEEWVSPHVSVSLEVGGNTHEVRYSVNLKRATFGRGYTCHIEAHSDAVGFRMPVDVVLKAGNIMPFRADDGQRIAQLEFDFTLEPSTSHTIELGRQQSPFWVCLFSDERFQLISPPTSQLKG